MRFIRTKDIQGFRPYQNNNPKIQELIKRAAKTDYRFSCVFMTFTICLAAVVFLSTICILPESIPVIIKFTMLTASTGILILLIRSIQKNQMLKKVKAQAEAGIYTCITASAYECILDDCGMYRVNLILSDHGRTVITEPFYMTVEMAEQWFEAEKQQGAQLPVTLIRCGTGNRYDIFRVVF